MGNKNPRGDPAEREEDPWKLRPDLAEWLEHELERMDKRAAARLRQKPRTPEQRAKETVQRRLRRLAMRLDQAADTLQHMHSDRSGAFRIGQGPGPLMAEAFVGTQRAPGLAQQFERVRTDAAAGCELSARFVEKWAAVYALCEDLRHQPLPERAPDYDPRERLARPRRKYPGHSDAAASAREFRWDRLPGDIDWENVVAD